MKETIIIGKTFEDVERQVFAQEGENTEWEVWKGAEDEYIAVAREEDLPAAEVEKWEFIGVTGDAKHDGMW